MAAETGVAAFERQQAAIAARRDQRDLLPRLAVPTLVLCGRGDSLIPFTVHQQVAELAATSPALRADERSPVAPNKPAGARSAPPGGAEEAPAAAALQFRVLGGCGHLPTIERPEESTEALLDWLAAERRPGRPALLDA